jgi:transposase InsO family protein
VILTGGILRAEWLELVGILAENIVDASSPGTAILAADGITAAGGVATPDAMEALSHRVVVTHAQSVVVLADGSANQRPPRAGCRLPARSPRGNRRIPQMPAAQLATLEWVWWWNNQRPHSELDYRTPIEAETAYYPDPASLLKAIASQEKP